MLTTFQVWQENCRIIVMTTKEMERGRMKCYKYWPDCNSEEQRYGPNEEFYVKTVKEKNHGEYVVRVLELRHFPKGNTTIHD
jgi:protein tyrosine phosphatase